VFEFPQHFQLQPAAARSCRAGRTLEVIRRSDDARVRLHANTRRLRASLSDMGYPIHQGSQQIIALEVGTESDTMVLRDRLEERNVFSAMFCAPATSSKRAMMRLTLNAGLMDSELDHVEAVAREIAPLVKPWDWPIARRARVGRSAD
jgi:CAI-1 autoinducer synthase